MQTDLSDWPGPDDLRVELRLCRPEGLHHDASVPGMAEFFNPAHYAGTPVVAMLCSPWLDGEALQSLAERMTSPVSTHSSVFIITMLAHDPRYWNGHIAPALGSLKRRTGAYIQVRVLPLPGDVGNHAGIQAEALHAKLYLLAQKTGNHQRLSEELLQSLRAHELREGFFGSANFTAKGQHLDQRQASHKWELVARIADGAGRLALLGHFRSLWNSAHRIDRDHPDFHRTWQWPYRYV